MTRSKHLKMSWNNDPTYWTFGGGGRNLPSFNTVANGQVRGPLERWNVLGPILQPNRVTPGYTGQMNTMQPQYRTPQNFWWPYHWPNAYRG